jgi:[protein-PII] uridylyltransferase
VFYVKDVFGLKVEHGRKLDRLRDGLLKALDPASALKAAE